MKKAIWLFLLLFSYTVHAGDKKGTNEGKNNPLFAVGAITATSLGAFSLFLHMKGKTELAENLAIGSLFATALTFYAFPQHIRFGKFISSWGVSIPAITVVLLLSKNIYISGLSSLKKDLIKYLPSFDK